MKKIISITIFLTLGTISSVFAQNEIIPADSLRKDLGQLLTIIEASHPDPYLSGGGKIAFHRRYQNIVNSLPLEGLTKSEFYSLILPFIASIGDSHTGLLPNQQPGQESGLPFKFKTVEKSLFVQSIPDKKLESLLGAKLISIENIPFEELVNRQGNIRGAENYYTKLIFMQYLSFGKKDGLNKLIPEWESNTPLKISFKNGDGNIENIEISIPHQASEIITQPSKYTLPSTDKADFAYSFLDDKKQTALLVIKDMSKYREGFEDLKARSYNGIDQMAASVYQNYNSTPVPDDWNKILEGIPSATEVFVNLIEEMKKANTKNLIIDLRDNTGGNSIMRELLIYLLYGNNALNKLDNGYSIKKYSELYFSQYDNGLKDSINNSGSVYDFRNENFYLGKGHVYNYDEIFKGMPTFWKVYNSKKFHIQYCKLSSVIVLSSPFTYSSGLNLLTGLYSVGAKVVGTPSGQAPNNFGDVLMFNLKQSGIKGFVSFKQNITYPDDVERGNCFIPDFPLTEQKYKDLNHDPNAEIHLGLEIINTRKNQ
ncbi:MAG: S41 family peptidase [Bacteroidetes bacterium]|nr:S41 family peptidase [Bacteroidota bacterium]